MSIVLFILAIVAAAFGVWWLAAMLLVGGLLIGAIEGLERAERRAKRGQRRG